MESLEPPVPSLPAFVTEIRIDGLSAETETIARSELLGTFGTLERIYAAGESAADGLTIRVWVTNTFDETVSAVLREYGRDEGAPYTAKREAGEATAKTMFARREDDPATLRATIVIATTLWGGNTDLARLLRVQTFLHELLHVVIERGRRRAGVAPLPPAAGRGFHATLPVLARIAHEECLVDTMVDGIIRNMRMATDTQGNALGLADLWGAGWSEAILLLLGSLCEWVEARVQHYRVTAHGLELIFQELLPRLDELVTGLGRALSGYLETGRATELQAQLADAPGFAAYLAEDWDAWVAAFAGPEDEAIQRMPSLIVKLVERLGLVIDDPPDGGYYLHVYEPRHCLQ